MDKDTKKMAAFDHVIFELTKWSSGLTDFDYSDNDLSKLKITKLLFFVAASTASAGERGLLSIFDNFYALPYGHVESTIQDHITDSKNFVLNKTKLNLKTGIKEYKSTLNDIDLEKKIEDAVSNLKKKNSKLIEYRAFDLVDLSHRWQSWITMFSLAKKHNKISMAIPTEMIMREPKIFA